MAIFYHVSHTFIEEQPKEFELKTDYSKYLQKGILGYCSTEEISSFLIRNYPNGLSQNGFQNLLDVKGCSEKDGEYFTQIKWTIEIIFELVRLGSFPNNPSRFTSTFGFDNKKSAIEYNKIQHQGKGNIYEVEAESNFRGDMNLVNIRPSMAVTIVTAEKYWRSEPGTDPIWEYLLKHPVKFNNKLQLKDI